MKFDSHKLKIALLTKRVIDKDYSLDQACAEIGISKATLYRVEKSKVPDMDTFCKLLVWLDMEPNDFFN